MGLSEKYCRELHSDHLANHAIHWWRCYLLKGHEGPCRRIDTLPDDVTAVQMGEPCDTCNDTRTVPDCLGTATPRMLPCPACSAAPLSQE